MSDEGLDKPKRLRESLSADPPQRSGISSLFRSRLKRDPNEIATQPSVFDDPEQREFNKPHPQYENLHRYDPDFTWTWGEEKSLITKLDWKITAWAWLMYLCLNLDQSSLIQAQADQFLPDLGMNTDDYNLGNTLYRVFFLCAELPSQFVSKKIGPDRWIPTLMVMWSITSLSQFWLSGRTSFLIVRAIMGFLQGGFIPDMILYLSYFFKGTELPLRLALFWTADRLKDVFIPLLAYGVLRLRGVHGLSGWRWLFLVEGLISLVVGAISYFLMTPSPTQTKAWFRPKGWFTESEEKVLVNRILRDDPSKGDMHNRQPVNLKMFWQSLCDYDLWPLYIIGLTFSIPPGPPKQYLTLSLKGLGFNTFQTNLLSIPPQAATCITLLMITWVSEKIGQRAFIGLFVQLWFLPCLVALSVIPSTAANKWGTYALITVILAYPTPHPIQAAWASRNSNSVRTRAVSAALYNMASQLSAIISSNIYRDDDKPEYRRGNRVLLAITCLNIVLYISAKVYYTFRNRSRAKKWDAMSQDEKMKYLDTTTDIGNKRLDFRFVS